MHFRNHDRSHIYFFCQGPIIGARVVFEIESKTDFMSYKQICKIKYFGEMNKFNLHLLLQNYISCFTGDLDFNPDDIERIIKEANDKLKKTEFERDECERKVKSTEEKVLELTNANKSIQNELKAAEKAMQSNERAKERVEMQFERTKETILLQVKLDGDGSVYVITCLGLFI